jgi:hypothetical protein
MKLIVLGVPHTQTTRGFCSCPFTMKAWHQCQMLHTRGHEVIHIGVEGSDPPCSENVAAISREEWAEFYEHPGAKFYETRTDGKFAAYQQLYARRVRAAIDERVTRPWEAIVACTWGDAQIAATKNLKQFVVEAGVGYRHTWAKYRVFVSYAWMHFHYGKEGKFDGNGWYDVVIPNEVEMGLFGTLTPAHTQGEREDGRLETSPSRGGQPDRFRRASVSLRERDRNSDRRVIPASHSGRAGAFRTGSASRHHCHPRFWTGSNSRH